MGKGKCGTCHFMPLFNGSVPPMYVETESEVLSVPGRPDTVHAVVDSDLGKISYLPSRASQKIPSKRRRSKMQVSQVHTCIMVCTKHWKVMDLYNRGGGSGIGIDLSNQTIPFDNLNYLMMSKVRSFHS